MIPKPGLGVRRFLAHVPRKAARPVAHALAHTPSPGLPTSLQRQAGANDLSHKGRGRARPWCSPSPLVGEGFAP
jgi:hypothetical protein